MIQTSGRMTIQQQLEVACRHGDSKYIRQHLASGSQEDGVDWRRLLWWAYENKHGVIVTMIQMSGRLTIQQQLETACQHGDSEYIRQHLGSGRQEDDVDWEMLLIVAYGNKHGDIVTMIQASGRVIIQQQLDVACRYGDSEYIRQHLASRSQEDDVDWKRLLGKAYDNKRGDIVTMIRKSGKVAMEDQLLEACRNDDRQYISHHLASGRQEDGVDWERLMGVAYEENHGDIVAMIQTSGRVIKQQQLDVACRYGDSEYIRQQLTSCSQEDDVDWRMLLYQAYDNKHGDIVTMIQISCRVTIQQQLEAACYNGDCEYITQQLASGSQEDSVDWESLLMEAYCSKHGVIVTMIQTSGRLTIQQLLETACQQGDSEYIRQHLQSRRQEDDVNWKRLLGKAYDKKRGDIVTMIRKSGWVAMEDQLLEACRNDDRQYISHHLASGRQEDGVDWERLMGVAYKENHGDVVTMIQASGRVTIQQQLDVACRYGDSEYIRHWLASGSQEEDVDWKRLLGKAYDNKRGDIVTMIQMSGRMTIQQQLWEACCHGDSEYIRQHLASGRQEDGVDWERLMGVAYEENHGDIVAMIQMSGRITIQQQLEAACYHGDRVFVSQVISEEKDVGHDVNWGECLYQACHNHKLDVIRVITAHRQTGPRYNRELMLACLNGRVDYVQQHVEDFPQETEDMVSYFKAAYYSKQTGVSEMLIQQGVVSWGDLVDDLHWFDINVELRPGFTDLHIACCSIVPDIARLRALVTRGADVNKIGYMGRTPLHMLCQGESDTIEKIIKGELSPEDRYAGSYTFTKQKGHKEQRKDALECMKYLIDNHAEVNARDCNGQTPSHLLACCHGGTLVDITAQLQVLLDKGADIDKQDMLGMTPLALMALHDNVKLMTISLNYGCDINKQNIEGKSPLYISCEQGHLKSARILANAENIDIDVRNDDGVTAISICSELGNTEIMSLLLEKTFDSLGICDKDGKMPLHKTVIMSHHESAKELIKHNAKVDVQDIKGNTPLHYAVENGDIDMINLLLDTNCVVDVKNNLRESPLFIAVENSMKIDEAIDKIMAIVDVLLKKGVPLSISSIYSESLLCNATENLTLHMIDWLRVANNSLHMKTHKAESSVFSTEEISMKFDRAKNKFTTIVDLLLDKGATLSVSNTYRESLLSKAVEYLNLNMMLYLLDRGVDVHTVNSKAQGLFHVLVDKMSKIEHNPERIQTFHSIINILEKHLDINATDINKQTPLHLAADAGCVSTINILLERGADLTVRDKFHFLPLMWCIGHDEAFKILLEKTSTNLKDAVTDFQKLVKLGYWQIKLNMIQEPQTTDIDQEPQIEFDICTQPQKFVREDWFCNKDLIEFYQFGKQRVNRHQFLDKVASQQSLTYINHVKIVVTLSDFIKKVLAKISRKNPLLACTFHLSGSEREGAKVIADDEIESLSVLTFIVFEKFEIPQIPGHPILMEFVRLLCKPEYRHELQPVLDDDYYLSKRKLCHLYGEALSDVLVDAELWAEFPEILRISHKDISPGIMTPLTVLWSDDVYTMLKISIDMVPAISVDWRPEWASNHPLLNKMQTLIVPKWKTTDFDHDQLMTIGISHWGAAFAEMPVEMKNGYRLCKVIKDVCPKIVLDQAASDDWSDDWTYLDIKDIVTSYMMKQIIIREYAEAFYDNPGKEPPVKTDREWAIKIFDELEKAFNEQTLRDFFIPHLNLLHDVKFAHLREKGIKYAQLCKLLLTTEAVQHLRKAYTPVPPHMNLQIKTTSPLKPL